MKDKKIQKEIVIYQGKNGMIEFCGDFSDENYIWGTQKQISELFGTERSVITKHINKILKDDEVNKKSNVQKMHIANSDKPVNFYSLDIILAVGYRTNSIQAVHFRKWATKTLKKHITQGYTINKSILKQKENLYLQVLEDIKKLSQKNNLISNSQIIDLIKKFSSTWFNLEQYDKQNLPKQGNIKNIKNIDFKELSKNLYKEIKILKKELLKKNEATELFAQEKNKNSLEGILGNVLQNIFGEDTYKTIEEKATHLLYFVIKNHPFNDGNKRTGAFSFIWFLQKMEFDFKEKISPETLTVLTLLIARSNPKDKNKMVGLVLLLLKQ